MSDDTSEFIRIDEPVSFSERDKNFQPWHKPRKHWVREKQWGNGLAKFASKHLNLQNRPLAYLTLPGEDFLDVRYLHRIALEHNFEIDFRGFDSTQTTAASLSLSEVKDLPNIRKESNIIRDRFETIARPKSLGNEAARRHLGFDVVNLDFCNSVASLEAGTRESAFGAIRSLVELQTKQRLEPWMLFLTSKCDPASVKKSVRSTLVDVFNANCQEADFQAAAESKLGLTRDIAQLIGGDSIEEINPAENFHFFGLGFTKWLIQLAYANWEVSPGNIAGYRVFNNDLGCDMLSSVYYFERVHAKHEDRIGLSAGSNSGHQANRKSEPALALRAMKNIAAFTDVDRLLFTDKEEFERVVDENAKLLAEARFDTSLARSWGQSNSWRPSQVKDSSPASS